MYDVICYEIETLSCFVGNSCFAAVVLSFAEVVEVE